MPGGLTQPLCGTPRTAELHWLWAASLRNKTRSSAETLWVRRPPVTWFGEQSLENMTPPPGENGEHNPLWRMEMLTPPETMEHANVGLAEETNHKSATLLRDVAQ